MTPPMNAATITVSGTESTPMFFIWRIVSGTYVAGSPNAAGDVAQEIRARADVAEDVDPVARDAPEEPDRRALNDREGLRFPERSPRRARSRVKSALARAARDRSTPNIAPGIHAARSGGITPFPPIARVSWIMRRKIIVVARLTAMP